MRDEFYEAREKLRGASAVADAIWETVVENQGISNQGAALLSVLIDLIKDAEAKLDVFEVDMIVEKNTNPVK